MTKSNKEIIEKKKNILRNIYQYSSFKSIPKDVILSLKLTYKVTEDFIARIYDEYKNGNLNLF